MDSTGQPSPLFALQSPSHSLFLQNVAALCLRVSDAEKIAQSLSQNYGILCKFAYRRGGIKAKPTFRLGVLPI